MLPIKDDQPRYSTPYVNWFLIGLNILIYLFQCVAGSAKLRDVCAAVWGGAEPLAAFLVGIPKYSLVPTGQFPSSRRCFCTRDWMHVLGNMWFLYIFGDNVEDYLGHFKYLVFYVLCGIDCDEHAGGDLSALECSDGGSERSDCGSAGGVFHFVSAGAGADVVFCVCVLYSGLGGVGRVVRAAISGGSQ